MLPFIIRYVNWLYNSARYSASVSKYLTEHKVHMHTGAIRQLLYDCAYVREDNPLAETRVLSSRTYAQTIQYLTLIASESNEGSRVSAQRLRSSRTQIMDVDKD